ncbi:hypothetical protein L202_03885 [Cryptococcus amylolentus CBS 6039]|uniref:NAD-dependent epimerase/dehydratase domain-containing protein n=1 Tax=Cryptococcus amylolentus CBS 6039 TaxID=1295533 RepID=A0A1E3HUL9_9TREE|nr:hypothetical protein L202_03885 [Cryptococcus amylolentus CBS 6039]ODN80024.1 hypothetical protein L202_03885 [Cryptococcus amylolentus CBS 6039]
MSPSIPTIAITGINGFIATDLVLHFLSRNWHVRGSVRTPSQADKLKSHPLYEQHLTSGTLKVIVVEDLAKSDLSGLLEGVDAIAGIAAPLPQLDNTTLTWDDYKEPTIEPILRILGYAQKSSTIKSVTFLSSAASTVDLTLTSGKVYTENDWNPYTEELCKTLDAKKDGMASVTWYFAAKKLAEQAVLRFQETERPSFSITTICPPMIYGPAQYITSVEQIENLAGGSQQEFLNLFAGKTRPLPHQYFWSFVDIRDVSEAFYLAITKGISGKFLVSAHGYNWQEFADKLRKLRPDLDAYFPLGEPKRYPAHGWSIDSSKSEKQLGIQWRSTEETLLAAVEFYEKLGLFKSAPGTKQV